MEITYGGFHKVESIVFSNDGSPEIIHLNTDEVITVTVAKPSERRARAHRPELLPARTAPSLANRRAARSVSAERLPEKGNN